MPENGRVDLPQPDFPWPDAPTADNPWPNPNIPKPTLPDGTPKWRKKRPPPRKGSSSSDDDYVPLTHWEKLLRDRPPHGIKPPPSTDPGKGNGSPGSQTPGNVKPPWTDPGKGNGSPGSQAPGDVKPPSTGSGNGNGSPQVPGNVKPPWTSPGNGNGGPQSPGKVKPPSTGSGNGNKEPKWPFKPVDPGIPSKPWPEPESPHSKGKKGKGKMPGKQYKDYPLVDPNEPNNPAGEGPVKPRVTRIEVPPEATRAPVMYPPDVAPPVSEGSDDISKIVQAFEASQAQLVGVPANFDLRSTLDQIMSDTVSLSSKLGAAGIGLPQMGTVISGVVDVMRAAGGPLGGDPVIRDVVKELVLQQAAPTKKSPGSPQGAAQKISDSFRFHGFRISSMGTDAFEKAIEATPEFTPQEIADSICRGIENFAIKTGLGNSYQTWYDVFGSLESYVFEYYGTGTLLPIMDAAVAARLLAAKSQGLLMQLAQIAAQNPEPLAEPSAKPPADSSSRLVKRDQSTDMVETVAGAIYDARTADIALPPLIDVMVRDSNDWHFSDTGRVHNRIPLSVQ
ncbi:hypothetical protein BD289DRAFT_425843 [Coniella lustricola]|uniref:Uncharacterized protein n=1 Tax=Coniella lustricola TaxID=2025994 RepID=A0A2T3AGS4_9PEZI|nr:hypothetical protein BD289DRAFT_425843 [Coniella lustricola]